MYQFNHFESMQACAQTNFVIGIDGCHVEGDQNLSTESVVIDYLTQPIRRMKV